MDGPEKYRGGSVIMQRCMQFTWRPLAEREGYLQLETFPPEPGIAHRAPRLLLPAVQFYLQPGSH
jgi:hypothetical protein